MRITILSLMVLMIFSGLLPLQAQDDEPATLDLAMESPATLDPVQISRFDTSGRDLVENLFIGLTRLNARTGQIEPDLAESWSVSDDGLLWTFTLRDDVQWVRLNPATQTYEAVRPVVASDVVFAVHRACDADRPSPRTTSLYIIAGCRAYANAQTLEAIDPARTIGIQAANDTTLQIRLVFPTAYFLTLTSQPEMRPLPAEFVDDRAGNWFRPDNLVTSGRWVVEEWLPGTSMQLSRNPLWEGEFSGNVETIDVHFDIPAEALLTNFNEDLLDVARLPEAAVTSGSFPADLLTPTSGSSLIMLGFSFNRISAEGAPQPTPLDSPGVRLALALALDRDALAAAVFGDLASGADHFTPRSAMAAPSAPGAGFNPQAAQQALANAGYPGCAGLGVLTFAISADPLEQQLARQMIIQWNTSLGCPVENFPLVQVPRQEIVDTAHQMIDVTQETRYPLWLLTWTADYPDAQAWVADALHCQYGVLRVGRACEQVDTLMNQAGVSQDIRSRFTTYNQIETMLFGSQGSFPVIPLVMEQGWWAKQPTISNIASYGPFQFDRWTVTGE